MKVFLVFAHPEPQSLAAALRDVAIRELESSGHEVRVSDLYAMHWKAEVDRSDFPSLAPDERLRVALASGAAFLGNTLTDDVKAEQEKLLWADSVILQFPLWWYSMPAILKGWVERVYSFQFTYGLGEYNDQHWGDRYGEGPFVGKRAMLVVTAGSSPEHFSARGIAGPIDDVLYPINHGILYYPGFSVLPPFVAYHVDMIDAQGFEAISAALCKRLRTMETAEPIPYRPQNGGDYEIPSLTLRPGLGAPNASGFSLHVRSESDTAQ